MSRIIYILALNYYDTSEQTAYFASGNGFNGTPDDVPANLIAEPRLVNPGNFESHMFRPGTTIGSSESGFGEIRLNNADGELDAMRDYGYGRTFTIYRGREFDAFPSGFTEIFTGTVDQVEFSELEIIVRVSNRRAEFYDMPLVSEMFSGDTSDTTYGAGGHVNATEDDWKGKSHPWVIGNGGGENWEPPLVNPGKQTFMASRKRMNDDWAVYMRGTTLTKGTKHTSITNLQAATVTSGQWDFYIGDGGEGEKAFFRIGGGLDGKVTMTGTAYRASGAHTAANCANDVLAAHGDSFNAGSRTALDSDNSAVTGIYIPAGGMRTGEALDRLLEGVGAAWFDTPTGIFKLARLEDPAGGTSVKTFESWMLLGDEKVRRLVSSDQGNGVPCSEIRYNYNRNYTIMSEADAAGIVASNPTRVARLKNEWKTVIAASAGAVLTKHPQAVPFEIFSLLTEDADASTESTRQNALRSVYSDFIEITVDIDEAVADSGSAISQGDVVTINYSRYSNSGSDKYLVLGIIHDYEQDNVSFRLWRPRT